MHTASRKLARALGSLLSVALSSLAVKQLHVIISGVIFINQGQVVLQSSVDEIREEKGMSVDALFREVFKC